MAAFDINFRVKLGGMVIGADFFVDYVCMAVFGADFAVECGCMAVFGADPLSMAVFDTEFLVKFGGIVFGADFLVECVFMAVFCADVLVKRGCMAVLGSDSLVDGSLIGAPNQFTT
jgi:hypothetical protein